MDVTITDCSACCDAEANPRSDKWVHPPCPSCYARALAATGAHEQSKAAGKITADYKHALDKLFGADWQQGAAMVKTWAEKMNRSDVKIV
jgi:hypothetical protein